ncbi:MAG: ribbon-helix-helix domain-containing protein [Sarcina sp.]
MDNEIFKNLKEYSKESHIPISKILDLAISEYLKNKK